VSEPNGKPTREGRVDFEEPPLSASLTCEFLSLASVAEEQITARFNSFREQSWWS